MFKNESNSSSDASHLTSKVSILLIGSGRLAKHLVHWHQSHHIPVPLNHWDRNLPSSELHKFLELKPIVWLAISDSAISGFYDTYLAYLGLRVVHFSGAFHHPDILSAHPLMTFSSRLFEPEFYRQIHFVISGIEKLEEAMPGFYNSFSVISKKDKAFYHALCVMGGNFPQLLWADVFREAARLNIPAAAFETYIRTVTENFIKDKDAALTGPLVRKDTATVQSNLSSLESNKRMQNIYSAFAKEYAT